MNSKNLQLIQKFNKDEVQRFEMEKKKIEDDKIKLQCEKKRVDQTMAISTKQFHSCLGGRKKKNFLKTRN